MTSGFMDKKKQLQIHFLIESVIISLNAEHMDFKELESVENMVIFTYFQASATLGISESLTLGICTLNSDLFCQASVPLQRSVVLTLRHRFSQASVFLRICHLRHMSLIIIDQTVDILEHSESIRKFIKLKLSEVKTIF